MKIVLLVVMVIPIALIPVTGLLRQVVVPGLWAILVQIGVTMGHVYIIVMLIRLVAIRIRSVVAETLMIHE